MAVQLATARIMREPSGSEQARCRSRQRWVHLAHLDIDATVIPAPGQGISTIQRTVGRVDRQRPIPGLITAADGWREGLRRRSHVIGRAYLPGERLLDGAL